MASEYRGSGKFGKRTWCHVRFGLAFVIPLGKTGMKKIIATLALVAGLSTAANSQQIIIQLKQFRVYVPPITLAPGFTIPGLAYPPIVAPPEPNWRRKAVPLPPPVYTNPSSPPPPPRLAGPGNPETTTQKKKSKTVAPPPLEQPPQADTTIPPTEATPPQIEQPPPPPENPPPTSSYFGGQKAQPRPFRQQ